MAALDGGRGRGDPAVRCGRIPDIAGAGGRLREDLRRGPYPGVSAACDSAPSVGPGSAAGSAADRDTVPVLRLRVSGARRDALLRRCVFDPRRGPLSGLRAST